MGQCTVAHSSTLGTQSGSRPSGAGSDQNGAESSNFALLSKKAQATKVGEDLARACVEKGIKRVVFDRNGYRYHGRIEALADGARSAGLEF